MNSILRVFLRVTSSLVLLLFFVFLQTGSPTETKALTDLSVSISDSAKSATATYTVSFTTSSAISKYGGKINVQFQGPNAYTYSSSSSSSTNYPNFNSASIAEGTTPSTLSFNSSTYNGAIFTTSENIAAGTEITLQIANVVNPSVGGYYFAHVWTQSYWTDTDGSSNWGGDYNSAKIEVGTNTNFTGKITDSDGTTPVPFTSVSLSSNGGSYSYYSSYTDKNGDFGIGDVPAGSYYMYIYAPYVYGSNKTYFPPDNQTITIESSGVTTKNLSFQAVTKTLSGKVTKTTEDGTAVTNATVYASKMNGSGYAYADVDSSGNYSINLPGGSWRIGLYAKTWPADWSYTIWDESVTFAGDSSAETKTKNFVVEALNSTITGTVLKPDGTAPPSGSVGLNFSSGSKYFYANSDASGSFSVKVTKGTFSVSGWVSDNNYSIPKINNVTIGEDETKSIGTINLVEKTDVISGTITDNTGAGVSGAYVSAWKNEGNYDWASATSNSDGTYSLKVTPGAWQVSAYPQWNSGHVYNGKPSSVTVTSGVTATKNFVFQKVTATINGTLTDPDGNVLTDMSSWVTANDGSSEWGYIGASMEKGVFTLKVPAGTWTVSASLYNGDYSSPDPVSVTIGDNETKSVSLKAIKNNSTISGTLYDSDGNKITNKWVSIYATKGKYGSWQNATIDQANGTYSLKVSEGTWKLGWWIDQSLGYSSGMGQDIEVTLAANETKTQDITFKKADSKISGKVTKADGTPMQWAWVTADTRDPNEKKSADTYYYSNGASSNNDGDYQINLPTGTYWVGGSMWSGSGYINPKRQKVTISPDQPATVNLTFRSADSTIAGTISGGEKTSSFVTGWSEDGGYTEANSTNEGAYSISASSGTIWHIKAKQQVNKDVYVSSEYIVDLTSGTANPTQNIELVKQSYSLPETKTTTFNPAVQTTINLDDGTNIIIPANTLDTSGQITLTVEPEIDLAEEADAKPVDYGYNITATDETGQSITSFNGTVTIEDKYTDQALSDSKVLDENELVAAYYNESTSSWDELTATVNETEKTVSYQTNHFTKFALVSSSDTTPPGAPTNTAVTTGDSRAKLSWTNPTTSDFAGIKIYMSQEEGKLGDLAATISNTTTTEQTIENLTNGTIYYFTIKANDSSGNNSINTEQVSAKPGVMPVTGSDLLNWITLFSLVLLFGFGAGYLYKHNKSKRQAHQI